VRSVDSEEGKEDVDVVGAAVSECLGGIGVLEVGGSDEEGDMDDDVDQGALDASILAQFYSETPTHSGEESERPPKRMR